MSKKRTNTNIDEDLLQEVRDSGVRNMSAHIENLLKKDLNDLNDMGGMEKKRIVMLREKLVGISEEWEEYLEELKSSA